MSDSSVWQLIAAIEDRISRIERWDSVAATATTISTGSYTLTVPATGTAALGTGAANQIAYWSGTNTIAGDAGLTYDAATDILTALGKITAKPAGSAGIRLDPNAATGDFTLSLSPANLTDNRRATFPNLDGTVCIETTGTWTAVFGGSTTDGTLTHSAQVGIWRRFGNLIFVEFYVRLSAVTTAPTGTLRIKGLPVAALTITGTPHTSVAFGYVDSLTLGTNEIDIMGLIPQNGSTYIDLYFRNSSGAMASKPGSALTATTEIIGSAVYIVS